MSCKNTCQVCSFAGCSDNNAKAVCLCVAQRIGNRAVVGKVHHYIRIYFAQLPEGLGNTVLAVDLFDGNCDKFILLITICIPPKNTLNIVLSFSDNIKRINN